MYVCLCKGITDAAIRQLGRAGIVGEVDLIDALGLTGRECCGRCIRNIIEIAALARAEWKKTSINQIPYSTDLQKP
jgi:bacterioferritin-associated ferredoxin